MYEIPQFLVFPLYVVPPALPPSQTKCVGLCKRVCVCVCVCVHVQGVGGGRGGCGQYSLGQG